MSEREFQYSDGKSSKFWRVHLDGCTHTVQFGRIGTTGQAQTKTFATEAEAHGASEKLIQEKLKKGYIEVSAPSTSSSLGPAAASPPAAPPAASTMLPPSPPAEEQARTGATTTTAAGDQPAVSEPTRCINLDATDLLWATWRPWTPLRRPQPQPFDLKETLTRLAQMPVKYGWSWEWHEVLASPSLAPEEARFWFDAMTFEDRPKTPAELATAMAGWRPSREFSLAGALERVRQACLGLRIEIVIPLANLLSPDDLVSLMVHGSLREDMRFRGAFQNQGYFSRGWSAGLRKYVLPYLTETERGRLAERIRPLPRVSAQPVNPTHEFWDPWYLAACLGMHEEVLQLVEAWPDNRFTQPDWTSQFPHYPQELVFGLADPRLVVTHMRRLRLWLWQPEHVRAWLAHTELGALTRIRSSIQATNSQEAAERLLEAFGLVEAPEAAPHMLELMLQSQASRLARKWLEEHPTHAIAGLVPVAAGRGHVADEAVQFLRALRRKGHEVVLRARIAAQDPETAGRLRAAVLEAPEEQFPSFDAQSTPEWLQSQASAPLAKNTKKPAWVDPTDLPPIRVDERRLNDAQIERLLIALKESPLDRPHALIPTLKQKANRGTLDGFVWKLFELWLIEGAPSGEKWAMTALGLLGSDTVALNLAPLIKKWPGESQHARAVLGLECLRAIGTDTALMQINGIAEKVKFKGLKTKAAECMEAIAQDRGLTRPELEDRIVPDCDLDERGSRLFDFGSRQFRMALGPDLKPIIRDEAGKLRPDLPKPTSKDHPEQANAAVAEWKLLKKQVSEAAKIQAVRLEQAMVTGRRWSRGAFELLLVRHPLMTHLTRRLVWGGFDAAGAPTLTFRVSEDQSYADAKDEAISLERVAAVGIVHPLLLAAEARSTWGELLSDYEIVPPFPQLGRPLYQLEPGEETGTEITRFERVSMPPVSLVGTLDRLGWTRAIVEDHGFIYEHSKPFYGAEVTAIIQYSGAPLGHLLDWKDADVEACFFVPGIYTPIAYHEHKERVSLQEVDPVPISEVLSDLATLAAKAR